jgi:four helix bundle protein
MDIKSYRNLGVWQLGLDLATDAYRLTSKFPAQERYGLASQLQRAAVSIPANVAEGHSRDSTKQYLFHVSVAMGSIAETETHLLLAERLGYADTQAVSALLDLCNRLGRMLRNLQKSLRARTKRSAGD